MVGLPATLALTFAAFTGWSLLLAVVPLALSQAGGSDALAGGSTAIFMAATVAAQVVTPRALRVVGYRPVLALGCALLGAPALVLLVTIDPVPTLLVSAVRGIGFGLLTVAGSALIAEIAPGPPLARATAVYGIAAAAPQIVGLPGGVALAQAWSVTPVFVLGGVIPLLAVAGVAALPPVRARRLAAERPALRASSLLGPVAAMIGVSVAFGGLSSLLPIVTEETAAAAGIALAVLGITSVIGRYWAGALAYRLGAGRLLLPALCCGAVGLLVIAVAVHSSVVVPLLVLGSGMFGLGFGVCQNDSLVAMFATAGPQRVGAASAAWNAAFDGGTGVGSFGLGVVATVLGQSWIFGCAAAGVLAAVPFTLRMWR